jgi:hypothetical protein
MNDSAFFVQVVDTLSNLEDYMARQLFGEVSKFDDLVEKLASLHESDYEEP